MRQTLLAYLCCPLCGEEFVLTAGKQEQEEILEGTLHCSQCKTEYPITNGIPRIFLKKDLDSNYSENFNMYFKKYWRYKKDYMELYRKRFYEMTGWRRNQIQGKIVLEAGCGGGRWVYQFAKEGAKQIIAFDQTEAVDQTKEILKDFDNIHYVQADIRKPPFKSNKFDIVHCHGVLHLLPNIKEGARKLADKVKINGELAILIYRNLTFPQQLIDNLVCFIPKRLPVRFIYYVSVIPTLFEYVPF